MVEVRSGRWCVPRLPGAGDVLVPLGVHAEQFVPLLVERFGDAWWRCGGLSLRAISTTVAGEPVRCHLEDESDDRCRVWMNAEGEALILQGSAVLGEGPGSALLENRAPAAPGRAPRVLSRVRPGMESPAVTVRIPSAGVDERLGTVTEPMACYRDPSIFGARVVPPASLVAVMTTVAGEIAPVDEQVEHLPGGLEIRHLTGPVLCEREYLLQGRVLDVAQTDRDEVLWYQADLQEAGDGTPVARMLRMERFNRGEGTLSRSAPG